MATQIPATIASGEIKLLPSGDKLGGVTNGTATGEALTFDAIGVSVQAYSASTTLLGNTVTGTGSIVLATSPTLATPVLGAASATSLACPTFSTSSGAMGFTPASGSGVNVTLSGAGDLDINSGQLYVDTSAARVGVNNNSPLFALDVTATGGGAEDVMRLRVDDSSSFLSLSNATGGAGRFSPFFYARTGHASDSLQFTSETSADTGYNPLIYVDGRISGGPVTTRPIIEVANYVTILLRVAANGDLTVADGAKVNVGGTTGTQIATSATAQKLSVFAATPIVQPTAAGQAALAAQGQQTLTDSTAGTAGTTLAAVTGSLYATDIPTIRNWIASLAAQLALVKTDVANLRTLVDAQRTAMVNFGSMKGS